MCDNDKRQKIIRLKLSQAIEKFISEPENLMEELRPIIEKLDRFHSAWIFKMFLRGEPDLVKEPYIRKEVADFLEFTKRVPGKYLLGMDSQFDLLREGSMNKEDLIRFYVDTVQTLKMVLVQEIGRKYKDAIRAILEYKKTENLDFEDEEVRKEWLKPREKFTGALSISELPEFVLKRFSLEEYSGTLDELSLEKIRDVACGLAAELSLNEWM